MILRFLNLLKRIILCLVFLLFLSSKVWAANTFIVKSIRLVGLHRISKGTALSYLPIRVGDELNDKKTTQLIRSLYSTDFFENVRLARQGNTLIVYVVERAAIGSVQVSGNQKIKKKAIQKMLKAVGIGVGDVYNHAAAEAIKRQLLTEYYSMGHYNARVSLTTTPLAHDRVGVHVIISEGLTAKIREIKIIGNHKFSQHELLKTFKLSTPKLWTFLTHTDQYSKEKLGASLDALKAFYLDHGYIRFKVDATTVSLTPDRTAAYIVVKVTEGPQYYFSGFGLKGKLILSRERLRSLITIKAGDVFSRKKLEAANRAIADALGEKGYGFVRIEPIPAIDDKKRQVFITFFISPGRRVYVNQISFSGNDITADYVLRNAIQQMEGGLLNTNKVRQSIRQLNLTGFFSAVNVKMKPVSGSTDKVNLNYNVKERSAGSAQLNFSYSTLTKFGIGAGINQPNFMGTGRDVGINFSRSAYLENYAITYFNPYYTTNGIGHGVTVSFQRTKPAALNIAEYTFDTYGITFSYAIPLSLNDTLSVGYGFNHVKVGVNKATTSAEILNFVAENGSNFNQILLSASWNHIGQDRAVYPTQGLDTTISGELSMPSFGQPLKYYKIGAGAVYLYPLTHSRQWIVELSGGLGYGNGYAGENGLPFFVNYFAGGLTQGQIRGYSSGSLGPVDSNLSPIGGNALVHGSVALIFPNFISSSLRTSAFFDVGNVYQTNSSLETLPAGPVRYSAGIAAEWRSPLGPLSFDIGYPLNKQTRSVAIGGHRYLVKDDEQIFQFTMGTTF